jgi:hypothetical protein
MLPKVAVMTEEPAVMALARPSAEIVATDGVPDDHVTREVMPCDVASEYLPVAVNCTARPLATVRLSAVTEMDWRVAPVTVSVVVPEMPPNDAVMTEEPAPTALTRPLADTMATDGAPEDQIAEGVTGSVAPSE